MLKASFPDLKEPGLVNAITSKGKAMIAAKGDVLVRSNDYVAVIPMVHRGLIKISRDDGEGNELFLYHIHPGQACAMSITCCLGTGKSKIKGVAEQTTEFIGIPSSQVEHWMTEFPSFKRFVFLMFGQRYEELLAMIDTVAFQSLDARLTRFLRQRTKAVGSSILKMTHQTVADEINTSREVVSRVLKQLERKGRIRLGRNRIEWIN